MCAYIVKLSYRKAFLEAHKIQKYTVHIYMDELQVYSFYIHNMDIHIHQAYMQWCDIYIYRYNDIIYVQRFTIATKMKTIVLLHYTISSLEKHFCLFSIVHFIYTYINSAAIACSVVYGQMKECRMCIYNIYIGI